MASAVEKGAGIGKSADKQSKSIPSLDNAWLCPSLVDAQSKSPSPVSGEVKGDEKSTYLHFSGLAAVANPLRHPLIPATDFSDDSGRPSDHCPVYFDLELIESGK